MKNFLEENGKGHGRGLVRQLLTKPVHREHAMSLIKLLTKDTHQNLHSNITKTCQQKI